MISLSSKQVASIRRQAKVMCRATGIPHQKCLDDIARAEFGVSWALVMNLNDQKIKSESEPPKKLNDPKAKFKVCLMKYLRSLSKHEVSGLCYNGSIWVNANDFISGKVDTNSFTALGPKSDGITSQYGYSIGAICFCNLDGIADGFVYAPEDYYQDDAEEKLAIELQLKQGRLLQNTKNERSVLLECVEQDFDSDWDRFTVEIEETQQDWSVK